MRETENASKAPRYFIFDCNVRLGHSRKEKLQHTQPQDIINIMGEQKISKALCCHIWAENGAVIFGNNLLIDITEEFLDRIERQFVVQPLLIKNYDVLLSEMKDKKVRSLKIFTNKFNLVMCEEIFGDIFTFCHEHKIPVWISESEIEWRDLCWALKNYPALNFVITDSGYNKNNMMVSLMRNYANLFFDMSHYNIFDGIVSMVNEFGSKRFMFGSSLPKYSPAAPINFILESRISETQKADILGNNLEKLLGDIRYE
ncbi:amidohydrolase family protein [bacterium]|nr:amidohydrolase family protein [bacterium]